MHTISHTIPRFIAHSSARLRAAVLGVILLFAVSVFVPNHALAQADSERASQVVATVNGEDVTLNLVGSLINQLPAQYRNQSIEVLYSRVVDDIIDTKLAAAEARETGLADNPLLNEIAQRAYERVLAEAWINVELRRRITEDMVNERYEEVIARIEGDDKPSLDQLQGRIIAELSIEIVDGIAEDLQNQADISRKEYRDVVPEDN